MSQTQLTRRNAPQLDYILVDCSSSMTDKWIESMGALDAYIATLKSESITSDVILHMFYNQNIDYIHRETPVADWRPLLEEYPQPFGSTPLYDAINAMGRRLRELDPKSCRITIVTDGDDTGSATPVTFATAVLDWCRAKGWQVTFIGADFSNRRMADMLGAGATEAIGVQKRLLADAAKSLGRKAANHARTGADMGFTDAEQQQFGGYLNAPTP